MRHGTYSIVARDATSGDMGVAVQSHWFSVGSVVSWARPCVGAVATQSIAEPAYGPDTLDRMSAGEPAADALAGRLAHDALARVRQVAAVDAAGRVAVHTGPDCIPHAGHVVGGGFSCQANMMARPTVPAAMADAFTAAGGDLADRLLEALEAAEAEGGDVRGRQSAAMLVVPAEGERWRTRVDLRVEDASDPIGELRRLLGLRRAYDLAEQASELLDRGRSSEARRLYERAATLAPDSDELLFWAGLAIAQAGDVEAGAAAVRRAAGSNPGWLALLERLGPEIAPAGADVRRRLAD